MDKKQIAKLKRQLVTLAKKRAAISTVENKRHQAYYNEDRKRGEEITTLRKQYIQLICPFKIGQVVKSVNPLGLFEIVSVEPKCYTDNPEAFQMGGVKLTKTGNWGFCSTRKVLNPEYCSLWTPDPIKEPKKKES